MRFLCALFLCALLLSVWPASGWALQADGVLTGTVTEVVDGDTLRLNTGHTVRLLDLNTPERGRGATPDEPLAQAAEMALRRMALQQRVQVQLGPRVTDPYGRVLGHVFLAADVPNRWINGGLVAAGLAHVYTFPDNRVYGAELLALENAARAARRGLWARPEWQVKDAASCCAEEVIGRFVVAEGVVRRVAVVEDQTYLNFGEDWRTDFSVRIDRRQHKFFRPWLKQLGPGGFTALTGQRVRVRGIAMPVNGVMVRATHAEQIELLP